MDISLMPAMMEAALAALLVAFDEGVAFMTLALIPSILLAAFLADVEAAKALRRRRGLGGYPMHPLAALQRAAGIAALRAEGSAQESNQEEFVLHAFMLPESISAHFPSGVAVVGGAARVAAWCVLHMESWPEGYEPRDQDYLAFDPSVPFGELAGSCEPGIDRLVAQSFQSYCAQLDLTSNGVMVQGGVLHMDEEAYRAFTSGVVGIRSGNAALRRGVSGLEYLCLRAAVQTGYDLGLGVYHPRAGGLRLDRHTLECLEVIQPDHWYMGTYYKKLEQVKSGKH